MNKNKLNRKTMNIISGYIKSMRKSDGELAKIIKGHLFIEYILNSMIEHYCKEPKLILKRRFMDKLIIIYSMDLLPNHIYKNIKTINDIRNKYAHNLIVESGELKYVFYNEDKEIINQEYFNKEKKPEKEYINMLCFSTMAELNAHHIKLYGETPKIIF